MFKSLEILGFKSFPEKITFDFSKNLTAIVGPNGSGKSNVVDAIRWVLGEQSFKNLRVSNLVEIIFSGNLKKPPAGFASVKATFDNSSKIFPVDFEEIEITRKIYRDGTSEYFLNKSSIRLKDLVGILASAKLGVKGLGIINQGSVDLFLRSSPIERVEMIEEMIGLKELRLKKNEASNKIEETKNNLEQSRNILMELEPNLRSLKRQVDKWEKRKDKELELQEKEKIYFSFKIKQLNENFRTPEINEELLISEIQTIKNFLKEEENKLTLENSISDSVIKNELQTKLRNLEYKRDEVLRSLGSLEGQIKIISNFQTTPNFSLSQATNKLQEILSSLNSFLGFSDLEKLKIEIQKLIGSLKKFLSDEENRQNSTQDELVNQRDKIQKELNLILGEIEKATKEINDLDSQEFQKTQSLKELIFKIENQRKILKEKEDSLNNLNFLKEKREFYENDLRKKMQESNLNFEEFIKQNQELINKPEIGELEAEKLEIQIFKLKKELATIGEVDEEIINSFNDLKERFEFITNQKQDLEKALNDLENLNSFLTEKIKTDFQEAINSISKEFQKYFEILFQGGKANLKIVPLIKNDNGNSQTIEGIEINVNLPRKKIKSIEALSGGERSLTSLAILLAIVSFSKPPFLVLDEVDASLDETNSLKLANLLKETSQDVQFILITHNRAVMQVADILYGVTMRDGISKVFTLNFKESQEEIINNEIKN
ncbi:MAG TPA: AAA family ATPase [Candidatus Paceibacterota bacterium]|nr:AAA family ATPase [Candidatus Paceibacterota bacterium]